MKFGKISFSVSFLQSFTLKNQGAWGEKSPNSVQKTPLFWGGYVRQE